MSLSTDIGMTTHTYYSFSYLTPGDDYPTFPLSEELNRVPPLDLELSDTDELRAQRLLDDSIVISLHDHPVRFPTDLQETWAYIRSGRQHTAYRGLLCSGLTAVFDNLMGGMCRVTSQGGWTWNDVVHDLGIRRCDLAHQRDLIVAQTLAEITSAHRDHRVALILGLESSTPIESEIDRIEVLYGLGCRQLGITYSQGNLLGSGLQEVSDGGLTDFGRRCVTRMNKVGMAIDVSHAGDQTSLDTIRHSTRPILITHSGSRTLSPTRRMKPDNVLLECAKRGGIVGLCAAPGTTISPNHPRHNLFSVMDHFEYCIDLLGIEHVTFGPDTVYGDHVGLYSVWPGRPAAASADQDVPYVQGLENPTECFHNIVRWLVKHAYSDDDIRAVIGGNTLRAVKEIW
jgi:membrane dipeptidase